MGLMNARSRLAMGIAAMAVILASAPAAAITKNYEKDFDHPFVGLAVFYDADDAFSHRCSGSHSTQDVRDPAGHCTDDEAGGVMASARVYFQQDAGAHYDPDTELDPVSGYPEYCAAGTRGDPLRHVGRAVQLRLRGLRRVPGHA